MPPRRSRKSSRKATSRKPSAKRSPSKSTRSARAKSPSKKSALTCPDCGFVAAHPMGLGRHRSTRHGVVSQRASRKRGRPAAPVTTAGFLTRQDAAKRAGVHYNTIRQWEQAGLLTTTRKPRVRGSLISAQDLQRVLAERASVAGGAIAGPSASSGADAAAIAALSRKVDALIEGLEGLLASVRTAGGARRGPGRPLGSKNKPKSAPAKAAPKAKAKARAAKPRSTSKRRARRAKRR